jgi:hypothetical protein
MIEIKFRYSGSDSHIIPVYFEQIFTLEEIENLEPSKWMIKNNIIPSSIKRDQYTGEKDKDEKELYFNDIIEHDSKRYRIGFSDGCYDCRRSFKNDSGDELFIFPKSERKKIGNIHENPELLK